MDSLISKEGPFAGNLLKSAGAIGVVVRFRRYLGKLENVIACVDLGNEQRTRKFLPLVSRKS